MCKLIKKHINHNANDKIGSWIQFKKRSKKWGSKLKSAQLTLWDTETIEYK